MKPEFWHEKWQANEIAFHQDAPHPLLKKHFPALGVAPGARVFVPLCGKSRDMLCLQDMAYTVCGLELSELAVAAFFAENHLQATVMDKNEYRYFHSPGLDIVCGDFFAVEPGVLGAVDAVFDRAALIALPAAMRLQYVEKLRQLTRPGTGILLITLEYQPGQIKPPPHAVTGEEVRKLYADWCEIEFLDKVTAKVKGQSCQELAWRLRVL